MDFCPTCNIELKFNKRGSRELTCSGCGTVYERPKGGHRLRLVARQTAVLDFPDRNLEVTAILPDEKTHVFPWDDATRDIMGDRYFTLSDWEKMYDAPLQEADHTSLPALPWGTDILRSPCPFTPGRTIAETHFLFLGLRSFGGRLVVVNRWARDHRAHFSKGLWGQRSSAWMKRPLETRWYLMPLEATTETGENPWAARPVLLPADYEVPFAVAEVVMLSLAYSCTDIRHNERVLARCADQTGVAVGFSKDGIADSRIPFPFTQVVSQDIRFAASRKIAA